MSPLSGALPDAQGVGYRPADRLKGGGSVRLTGSGRLDGDVGDILAADVAGVAVGVSACRRSFDLQADVWVDFRGEAVEFRTRA